MLEIGHVYVPEMVANDIVNRDVHYTIEKIRDVEELVVETLCCISGCVSAPTGSTNTGFRKEKC